ncbi:MAG TPA: hypothetical protein VHX52_11725 [Steroidobacteraceae bacterium]|nr:hypothetical protein [Steroidobacteraceae bacterium]
MDSPRVLHSFSNVNQEPDPLTDSPNITDPSEDTAPLQGSLDRSDDDAMVDEYRASDEESPDGPLSAGGGKASGSGSGTSTSTGTGTGTGTRGTDPSTDLERARGERAGRGPDKGR